MGLDRGGGALDGAGSECQVTILLRNHLDVDVDTVLLEDAGFVGQRQRRETGPAAHAQRDLRGLRLRGACGTQRGDDCCNGDG